MTDFAFHQDQSEFYASYETLPQSSSPGKSSPPDEFRSSTISSTRPEDILRDRVRGIEREKRWRKIERQFNAICG